MAKNLKVPFRSNFKIFKNKLIAANQNNELFFFDKINGNTINSIPTEKQLLKISLKIISLLMRTIYFFKYLRFFIFN